MIDLRTAKTQLSRLIDQAASGEEVVIARGGHPVARLVALPTPAAALRRRKLGILAGQISITPDFDSPLPEAVIAAFEGR